MNDTSSQPSKSIQSFFFRIPLWLRWALLAVVVVALGAGGYAFYQNRLAQATTAAQPALQTATVRTGNITIQASGTGTLIASAEANVAFRTNGQLKTVSVKVGDQVKQGQLLAELDNTPQQIALAQAQQNLLELTSPAAIATAQQNVATDQQNVYNDQAALNNLLYQSTNQSAIQNAQSALVLAQNNLDHAQKAYANISGDPNTDPRKASAYQDLYAAQLSYNSAVVTYNLYTGKPNQASVDKARATLALAQATLAEDQTLVAALTGGTLPANPVGAGYVQLMQARQAVQNAQDNLDATRLIAPISGTVLAINNQVGDTIGSSTFITIADLSQSDVTIYMDPNDWANVKTGYNAEVTFDALPNQVFPGKVTQVDPQLVTIQGNQVVEGMVVLDPSQSSGPADPIELPLGVSASVNVIAASARNVLLVPVQALHLLAPGSYAVFVMTNGKPVLRVVTVGLQDPTFAEIKTGLKAGDVVTTGIQATVGGATTSGQGTTP